MKACWTNIFVKGDYIAPVCLKKRNYEKYILSEYKELLKNKEKWWRICRIGVVKESDRNEEGGKNSNNEMSDDEYK